MKRISPTPVVISFDIESRGKDLRKNGIASVGICVAKCDVLEVIHKERIDLKPLSFFELNADGSVSVEFQQFEERCVREFWSKNSENLKRMQENAIDPLVGIAQFRKLIDKYDDKVLYEARIITDNPSFDASMLNYYLSRANLEPLHFDSASRYRSVVDTDSYSRGVLHMGYGNPWVSDEVLIKKYGLTANHADHDHMPENDAEYIYSFHTELVNNLK